MEREGERGRKEGREAGLMGKTPTSGLDHASLRCDLHFIYIRVFSNEYLLGRACDCGALSGK